MTPSLLPNSAGSRTSTPSVWVSRAQLALESSVFFLVSLLPWLFAGVDFLALHLASWIVFLSTIVLLVQLGLKRHLAWKLDPVHWCLVGLIGWSCFQLVPLPESVVGVLNPQRLEWHRAFIPEQSETWTDGPAPVARPNSIPLSVNPQATRDWLLQLLGVFLVYTIARSVLASRESFRRLAWCFTINGVLLALFALGHAVSAKPAMVYWNISVPGAAVFGPFICRNHYPDFIALCAGLCLALLISRQEREDGQPAAAFTPKQAALAAALALMLLSVVLSLSRGGLLCVVAAGIFTWLLSRIGLERTTDDRPSLNKYLLAVMISVGVVLAAWLGTASLEQRLKNSRSSELLGTRFQIWKDSSQLIPGSWLTGTGAGTFTWAEPLTRTGGSHVMLTDQTHNEYLEALIEGGAPRAVLTLLLAGSVLVVIGRGYLRRRSRSVGPFLLGAWAGLLVSVLHNAFDFGLRIPAVALGLAVVAAYALAAAMDSRFIPSRVKVRRVRSQDGGTITETLGTEAPPEADQHQWELQGLAAIAFGLLFVLIAAVIVLQTWNDWQADRLKQAAEALRQAQREEDRLRYLEARVKLQPHHAEAHADLGQARLDQAARLSLEPTAALSGAACAVLHPPSRFPSWVLSEHVFPAVQHFQHARQLNPLLPIAHARLGLLSEQLQLAEPWRKSLERFQRLSPIDPDAMYLIGREYFRRGDTERAWATWQRSLKLSDKHLVKILQQSQGKLSPQDLREKLIPPDPVALWRALQQLAPRPNDPARREWLELIKSLGTAANPSAEAHVVLALTYTELDLPREAEAAWRIALQAAPDRTDYRDRYARWLEQDERYREAIEQLELLLQVDRSNTNWQDRLDAMKHGLSLQERINRK